MTTFDVRVECAFTSGFQTAAASRQWTDLTPYVEGGQSVSITRGRQDEFSQVQPSSLTGLVLNNTDGRFTPQNAAGALYPNVKKGRPLRMRVKYPANGSGNFASPNQASVETSAADWNTNTILGTYDLATSVAQSAVRAQDGTKSVLATWSTTAVGNLAGTTVRGLTGGRSYIASVYVYVPSGSPNVRLEVSFLGASAYTAVKDAWVRLSATFTATNSTHYMGVNCATATAGQQCWIDALMVDEGSTLAPFTTASPPFYDLFTGYVDEWDVEWPGGGDNFAVATLSASSRTARMATGAALRSVVEEEVRLDRPTLYYTLGDAEGSTMAGNSAATRQESLTIGQSGTGGTLDFGAGTGPGTDGLSAPILTRASAGNGKYLKATLGSPLTQWLDSDLAIGVSFNTSSVSAQTLIGLYGSESNYLWLATTAAGKLQATAVVTNDTGVTTTTTVTSAATVTDGLTHRGSLRVVLTDATGTGVLSLVTDDVVTSSAPIAFPTFLTVPYFPGYWGLFVGGPGLTGAGGIFTGTLAHAVVIGPDVVMPDARLVAHFTAAATGFSGESTDTRIRRYAAYAGVPDVEVSTELGTAVGISHADTTGAGPLEMMQRVIETEDGLLFDGKDGRLTMHARSHRYNTTPEFVLSIANQDTTPDLSLRLDDQGMCNDFTASRAGGATVRSVDAASVAEYGYYRDERELLTISDAEVQSAADWRTSRYGVPRVKLPALPLDLVTIDSTKIPAILAADLGSRLTLADAPSQAPATTQDVFIEGIGMSVSVSAFDVTLNVSAADLATVWQLDSSTFSALDSTTRLAY